MFIILKQCVELCSCLLHSDVKQVPLKLNKFANKWKNRSKTLERNKYASKLHKHKLYLVEHIYRNQS